MDYTIDGTFKKYAKQMRTEGKNPQINCRSRRPKREPGCFVKNKSGIVEWQSCVRKSEIKGGKSNGTRKIPLRSVRETAGDAQSIHRNSNGTLFRGG